VGLPGESHATITSQYYGPSGTYPHFGSSTGVWGDWVAWQQNPPAAPTSKQVGTMASAAANYWGLASDSNAQIVVLTPQGNQPDGFPNAKFCAWHSNELSDNGVQLSYTLMPWLPDVKNEGCDASFGSSPNLNGWTEVGGHEFAESATDPVGDTGYYTPDPNDSNNSEIGDRCGWTNTFTEHMPNGSSFAQQQLYSNLDRACVSSMPAGAITGDHGKCVDDRYGFRVPLNPIDIYTCNQTGAQQIIYTPSSGHLIVDGGCLNVNGASHNSGAKIIWWPCGNAANEDWQYDSSTHAWQIYRSTGAMCLDDPGGSSTNLTQLQIYTCNNTAAQQWYGPKE
jgi:hypothetical protein